MSIVLEEAKLPDLMPQNLQAKSGDGIQNLVFQEVLRDWRLILLDVDQCIHAILQVLVQRVVERTPSIWLTLIREP